MMWFFAILIVLALGGVAVVAAGRGAPMADVYGDRPDALVPGDRRLAGDDLRRVRFSLAFRGYRMSEVDALLDRIATEMEASRTAEPHDVPPTRAVEAETAPEGERPATPEGRGDEPTD